MLLGFMGEVSLEAIINPLRWGPGLVQGWLKNGVHIGHSLCFTPQWERERWLGGLGGSPSWSRILGGVPGPLVSGLPSPDQCESVFISGCGCRGGQSCALQGRWRQFPSRCLLGSWFLFISYLLFPRDVFMAWRCISTSMAHSCSSPATHLHGDCFSIFGWVTLLPSQDVVILLL